MLPTFTSTDVHWKRLLGVALVGVAIWFTPRPSGVNEAAWHLLAIFAGTIVGLIVKPLPMGAVALLGITASVGTGTLEIEQALSGFGDRTIWLIVVAFFISRGFITTGLGARIAYLFIAALGNVGSQKDRTPVSQNLSPSSSLPDRASACSNQWPSV